MHVTATGGRGCRIRQQPTFVPSFCLKRSNPHVAHDAERGEQFPHHRHEADYVFVYTMPTRVTAFLEGKEPSSSDFEDGFVQYTEVGPAADHHIRNVSFTRHLSELGGGHPIRAAK